MEKLNNCPVCNSDQSKHFLSCKDNTVSKAIFKIVECVQCSFKYTNPRPFENDLGAYYISEEYVSHSNTSKGFVNFGYQKVRKYTLKKKLNLINKLKNKKGNLLDVGCGTGEFLNTCALNNWKTIGVEPSDAARNYAKTNYNLNVVNEGGFADFIPLNFDVITMWHVLEHVPHLNKRIEELKSVLNNDGVILIAVPNCSSYDANYYKENWAAYDLPRHLYHFTPATITKLLAKHGFKLIETVPMKFDSYYVSMLSEKYKGSSLQLLKGFLRGFISNLKAGNNKYSSQIYLFKKA